MKPRVNNPAWVQAIQDVMDLIAAGAYPPDQINADPNTTAFQQFLGRHRRRCSPGGATSAPTPRTTDTSVVGDVTGFSIIPGSDEVYNSKTGDWETPATARTSRRTWPISAGAST